MQIYNSTNISFYHLESPQCIYQKWVGFIPGDDFRKAVDFVMNYLRKHGRYTIISDVTEQRVVAPKDQEYVEKQILEFMEEKGFIRIAFILKEKSMITACVEHFDRKIRKSRYPEINNFFNDLKSAQEWLASELLNKGNA